MEIADGFALDTDTDTDADADPDTDGCTSIIEIAATEK